MDPQKSDALLALANSKAGMKILVALESCFEAVTRPLKEVLAVHGKESARLIRDNYAHKRRMRKLERDAKYERRKAELEAEKKQRLLTASQPEVVDAEIIVIEDQEAIDDLNRVETEQTAKRRTNILAIVAESFTELPGDASDEPIDPDFAARFFSGCQDVSQEDVQKLWAKLLSGEAKQPGSFSLRTLDVLRNLTTAEAHMVQDLARFVERTNGWVIHGPHARQLIPVSRSPAAIDTGLFRTQRQWIVGSRPWDLTYGGATIHVAGSGMLLDCYDATEAGRQLLSLCPRRADPAYLEALVKDFHSAGYSETRIIFDQG